jgi:hypothetical protein
MAGVGGPENTPDWQCRILVKVDYLLENVRGIPELLDALIIAYCGVSSTEAMPLFQKCDDRPEDIRKFLSFLLSKGTSIFFICSISTFRFFVANFICAL